MTDSERQEGDVSGTAKGEADDYVGYATGDPRYFGARDIIAEEAKYIRLRRGEDPKQATLPKDLTGLALSGGGIRSASFCLGVMQALAHNGWLKNVDYLSSVSGGGYIGSSVSWLLSRPGEETRPRVTADDTPIACPTQAGQEEEESSEDDGKEIQFGLGRDDFPYGTYPMSGSNPRQRANTTGNVEDSVPLPHRYRGKLLRYLRQQSRYLTPGGGINAMSLTAVILRGMMVSWVVYFGLLLAVIVGLHPLLTPLAGDGPLNYALLGACLLGAAYVLASFAYAASTRLLSKPAQAREAAATGGPSNDCKSSAYDWRQRYERRGGQLLGAALLLLLIGAIPVAHDAIAQWTGESEISRDFEISGERQADGSLHISGTIASPVEREASPLDLTDIGYLSTLLGALSTVFAFFKGGNGKRSRIPMGLVALLASAVMTFGLLLLAYHYGNAIHAWIPTLGWGLPPWLGMLLAGALIGLAAFLIGQLMHINYVSIHRYYRDRLMELFMPDVDRALCDTPSIEAVCRADKAGLHELIPPAEDCEKMDLKATKPPLPYHIINANVVLEASGIPKFRGRGGDNFILTPYFCGSNATGWCRSSTFMGGRMTLPTAMAISGAAVNPGTGVGGEGVTRQPLLSMLMGLLNIRLGYWAPNPDPDPEQKNVEKKRPCSKRRRATPNFIFPGLCEIFTRWRMNEKGDFVQLTDGGHFENLALYELIRRQAKVIVVCDGGADPDYQFSDFANAVEKVRTDFGVLVQCDAEELQKLVPGEKGSEGINDDIRGAEQGHLVCSIIYPDGTHGRLIYLKTTFFKSLSADLYGYKKTHPQFPDEPTSDQFFDEKQFEAYRELGFQTAWQMMDSDDIRNDALIWQRLARS